MTAAEYVYDRVGEDTDSNDSDDSKNNGLKAPNAESEQEGKTGRGRSRRKQVVDLWGERNMFVLMIRMFPG